MRRAYGKLELNDRELKCQEIYEKKKPLGKAQAHKIHDGAKKSFRMSSEAIFRY